MQVHELRVRHKRRKRLGRGLASRRGTYAGRGVKGQKARAGARIRPGFEGGQTPLYARLPKRRGFRSLYEKSSVVNLEDLERQFPSGMQITHAVLVSAGLVRPGARRSKILGDGTLTKSFAVHVPTSAAAKEKIERAGGKVISAGGMQPLR